jgi:cytochrome c oxidase subunit I
MAIETEPGTAQRPGGGEPAGQPGARSWWLRPAIHTGIIGAVAGYALGHWLGNLIASGYQQISTADANDTAIVLGYLFLVIG